MIFFQIHFNSSPFSSVIIILPVGFMWVFPSFSKVIEISIGSGVSLFGAISVLQVHVSVKVFSVPPVQLFAILHELESLGVSFSQRAVSFTFLSALKTNVVKLFQRVLFLLEAPAPPPSPHRTSMRGTFPSTTTSPLTFKSTSTPILLAVPRLVPIHQIV